MQYLFLTRRPLLGRQEKYRSIKHHKFKFPVGKMCKMFKASKSGHYHWLVRWPSKRWSENQAITSLIHDVFKDIFGRYGDTKDQSGALKKGISSFQAQGRQDNEIQ